MRKSGQNLVILLLVLLTSTAFATTDMPLKGLDGEEVNLADYRGKWVVVNYWATWCPPCIEEMPELQAFHDANHETRAVVIGMNSEFIPVDLIKEFLDDYFITYPNFSAGPVSNTPLGTVPGLPTTFLVSPEGTVEAKQVGMVTRQMIENFIDKWEASNP